MRPNLTAAYPTLRRLTDRSDHIQWDLRDALENADGNDCEQARAALANAADPRANPDAIHTPFKWLAEDLDALLNEAPGIGADCLSACRLSLDHRLRELSE